MNLKYSLAPNLLTSRVDNYTARAQNVKSHDLESIIRIMLAEGSRVTRADILAVLSGFFEVAGILTAKGEAINTDLIKTSFSITGTFDSVEDTFDNSRHAVRVNINAGKILKEAVAQIQIKKVTAPEAIPRILNVKDSISGSVNDRITSNGVLEIIGSLLKIEGDNVNNGVYLIGSDGTRNKVVTLIENKPRRLFVILPTLAAGEYTLQIITQHNGGTPWLKSPRTGVFHMPLTIA